MISDLAYDTIHTAFGTIRVVVDRGRLSQVSIEPDAGPPPLYPDMIHDPQALTPFTAQIKAYLQGDLKHFDLPLDFSGTSFQNRVWAELARIPFGQTRSYQDIAAALGNPSACRAVGSACGKNPIPIVVPCHRVIAKSGGLGGFSGGLDVKKALLAIEGHTLP